MTGFAIYVDGDTTPLVRVDQYLGGFDATARKLFFDTANTVYASIRPQMIEALRYYPPVPAGSTYKRTFRLRNGWDVTLEMADSAVYLVVRNATPYTRFVVGTLTTNDAQARATQRAFHARNGWPVALDTTRIWFNQFTEAFIPAFIEALLADAEAKL